MTPSALALFMNSFGLAPNTPNVVAQCHDCLDRVDPTPARIDGQAPSPWDADAQELFDEYVQTEPVLVQISAAKRLRDRAERDARRAGEARVTVARVATSRDAMRQREPA